MPIDKQTQDDDTYGGDDIINKMWRNERIRERNKQNLFDADHRRMILNSFGMTDAMMLRVDPKNPYFLSQE